MVVSSSDSNSTLVSLRGHVKKGDLEHLMVSASPLSVVVSIAPPIDAKIASLDDSWTDIQLPEVSSRLKIPKNFNSTTFLQRYGVLADQRDVLLAQDVVVFDDATKEPFVYVAQGEIATITNSNSCNVLLSDRATTCHIVAIWSCCGNDESSSRNPCSTLTHIDAAGYDASLRTAFLQHDTYHQQSASTVYHVHIVGGFDEIKSLEISASLLQCLAQLSTSYRIVLETCVISSLNQDEILGGPRLRGLALDCQTGHVYPAHCTAHMILGPVRGLRLWTRGETKELLQLFSDATNHDLLIIPKCTWQRVSSRWNKLSDEELLANCSTSPEHEDAEDFCHHLRSTFAFCNQVTPEEVFGKRSALAFKRFGGTNRWVPALP